MAMTPLDRFGQFVIEQLRDNPLEFYDRLAAGQWKAPRLKELQAQLAELNDDQRIVVRQCVVEVINHCLHDFLFALAEGQHERQGIDVLVDREPVAGLSDGLQGEPYSDEGWIARFSRYPET